MMLDWILTDRLGITEPKKEVYRLTGFVQGAVYMSIIYFGINFVFDTIMYGIGMPMNTIDEAQRIVMTLGVLFLIYFYIVRKQLLIKIQEEEKLDARKTV